MPSTNVGRASNRTTCEPLFVLSLFPFLTFFSKKEPFSTLFGQSLMSLVFIVFTFFLLSIGITINKYLLSYFTPVWFVAFRTLSASFLLLLYTAGSWDRPTKKRLQEDLWQLLLIAVCTTFLPTWLKAFALQHMSAAKTTLLGSLDPFVTALYAYLLFGEKATWKKMTGIFFGWIGLLLMLLWPIEQKNLVWGSFLSWHEAAVLGATALSRLGWSLAGRFMKQKRYLPSQINTLVMSISGVSALLFALSSDQPFFCQRPKEHLQLILFAILLAGINVVGYALYADCLKRYSLPLVSLAGFLVPLFVSLFAWKFLQEPLTPSFLLAFCLIFTGLLFLAEEESWSKKFFSKKKKALCKE